MFFSFSSFHFSSFFFFFNDTATTEIYTLSLHDALPILPVSTRWRGSAGARPPISISSRSSRRNAPARSEEHTSELQSLAYLVCRLLLEKKKKIIFTFKLKKKKKKKKKKKNIKI